MSMCVQLPVLTDSRVRGRERAHVCRYSMVILNDEAESKAQICVCQMNVGICVARKYCGRHGGARPRQQTGLVLAYLFL